MDEDAFFENFKKFVKKVLIIDCKSKGPYVERIMEFIGLTCFTLKQTSETSHDDDSDEDDDIDEHPFLKKLFTFLLQVDIFIYSIKLSHIISERIKL